jgi:hypothetical protein
MMALSGGPGMMPLALVVEGLTATLGVEAIDALLARRAVGARVWPNFLGTLLLLVILLAGHPSADGCVVVIRLICYRHGVQLRPERHAKPLNRVAGS